MTENDVIALLIIAETVTRMFSAAWKHAAGQRSAERTERANAAKTAAKETKS